MPEPPSEAEPSIEITVRVRYPECDPQGVAHHSVFVVWMEMARTELLRAQGVSYRECEERGVYFVVARMNFRFRRPARYDDELRIRATMTRSGGSLIDHAYTAYRDDTLIAEATTTIVCTDAHGKPQRIPDGLLG